MDERVTHSFGNASLSIGLQSTVGRFEPGFQLQLTPGTQGMVLVDEFYEFERKRFTTLGETEDVRFRGTPLRDRPFVEDETSGARKTPKDVNLSRSVSICHIRVAKEPN